MNVSVTPTGGSNLWGQPGLANPIFRIERGATYGRIFTPGISFTCTNAGTQIDFQQLIPSSISPPVGLTVYIHYTIAGDANDYQARFNVTTINRLLVTMQAAMVPASVYTIDPSCITWGMPELVIDA